VVALGAVAAALIRPPARSESVETAEAEVLAEAA